MYDIYKRRGGKEYKRGPPELQREKKESESFLSMWRKKKRVCRLERRRASNHQVAIIEANCNALRDICVKTLMKMNPKPSFFFFFTSLRSIRTCVLYRYFFFYLFTWWLLTLLLIFDGWLLSYLWCVDVFFCTALSIQTSFFFSRLNNSISFTRSLCSALNTPNVSFSFMLQHYYTNFTSKTYTFYTRCELPFTGVKTYRRKLSKCFFARKYKNNVCMYNVMD